MKITPNYKYLFFEAILAGVILTLAGIASVVVSSYIAIPALALLIKATVFPVGLIAICFSGFKLFTGCCGAYARPDVRVKDYFLILIVTWVGNLIGAMAIAFLFTNLSATLFVPEVFGMVAFTKANLSVFQKVVLGFLCNYLICWGILTSNHGWSDFGKMAILFIAVFLFIVCGFEHSIANMGFLFIGKLFHADITWGMVFSSLGWVTFGNFLGGLFAALYEQEIYLPHYITSTGR